jgi:hypothetical protein
VLHTNYCQNLVSMIRSNCTSRYRPTSAYTPKIFESYYLNQSIKSKKNEPANEKILNGRLRN